MVPGLLGEARCPRPGSDADNALFLNDPPKAVERKVRNAFTGGRATVEEQRRLGATPEVCSVWALWRTRFAESEEKFREVTAGLPVGRAPLRGVQVPGPRAGPRFYRSHAVAREKVKDWAESTIVTIAPRRSSARLDPTESGRGQRGRSGGAAGGELPGVARVVGRELGRFDPS